MRFAYSDTCLKHDPGVRHPETPDRLRAIREGLKRKHGVEYVEPDPASVDRIASVHDREFVESVKTFCAEGGGNWDPDTVAVPETWDAALASAGLACWAAEAALDGNAGRETPFSIGRPPGHHAVSDEAMGFCFFNNVAVAAQFALDTAGIDRVAVVDWDVHHGNGTDAIFESRSDVYVCSIHERGLYPGTGAIERVGEGDGTGTTMNVPMPSGAADADYLATIETVVGPALERFEPELLIVSAGFDAHRHDPISRIRLSTEAYALMTDRLRSIGDRVGAPLAFVLEGGYGLEVLAESVGIVHETFDGRPPMEPNENAPSDEVEAVLEQLTAVHEIDG